MDRGSFDYRRPGTLWLENLGSRSHSLLDLGLEIPTLAKAAHEDNRSHTISRHRYLLFDETDDVLNDRIENLAFHVGLRHSIAVAP